jgi:prepilin-type N-terminal cleavage/methylation domain-containing protein
MIGTRRFVGWAKAATSTFTRVVGELWRPCPRIRRRANRVGTRPSGRLRPSSTGYGRFAHPTCVIRRGGQDGFTLVEIVVALAILTLCLSVLLRTISDALWHTSEAEAQAEAASMARSLLAQAGGAMALRDGEAAGQLDNGFRWRLRMEGYGGGADSQALPVRAYRVTAEVFWNDRPRERSLALTTLRLGANETTRR